MKNREISVFLRWFSLVALLFLLGTVHADEIKVPLKELVFKDPMLRGIESELNIKVPVPSRYTVKSMKLHLEVEKSVSLVKERSSLSVFFNRKLLYQRPFEPLVDIMTADINIPVLNLEPYNDLTIKAIHHYCINCCEFEGSPELWSKVDLDNSYLSIEYEEKTVLPDTLLIRDYVLDPKLYNPVKLGVLTESKDDFYLSMAARLAGHIGNFIKYRKIRIEYLTQISDDRDIFVIGSKDFIRKMFGTQITYVPDIGIIPNPLNDRKGIVVISGDSPESINRNLMSFMSVKSELYTGRDYYIKDSRVPDLKQYSNLISIPLGRKVYLKELGYEDFKFAGIFPPPAVVEFRIPQGLFIQKNKKILFHFAFNYGAGTREDSVINIYLNDEYVTSLKMEKRYGVVLQEEDIKIPAYLLHGGLNRLKIEYAMMPPGGGFCISPNIEALRGTLFTSKSYIEIPKMPMWFEMPYLEYFVDTAFPYSMEGGLADTLIYIPSKDEKYISAALTLSAYMGTRIFATPYEVQVSSELKDAGSKNIILIGSKIPDQLQDNLGLKIMDDRIEASFPVLKDLFNGRMFKRIIGLEEGEASKTASLLYTNRLTDQVFFMMARSPFDSQKTVMFIYSKNPDYLYRAVYSLFEPKFAGQIKGDISVWDFYQNIYYSDNISKKYYVGNLPFWQKIMYTVGFSPTAFALFTVALVVLISLVLKKILDYREKRRLEGEV